MPAENTEKPALPRFDPNASKVRLMRDIQARYVRAYHFIRGIEVRRKYDDRQVTYRVAILVNAGLASYGAPDEYQRSIVSLTPAGEEWLNRYGSNE